MPVLLPGSSPADSVLVGGQTSRLAFARLLAQALFAYGPSTDFAARNTDLLLAAAPAPWGDPAALQQDLARYTPTGVALDSIRKQMTVVTVDVTEIGVSAWAGAKLKAIGAKTGTYGIDVAAVQTITSRAAAAVKVPVQLGLTVACPPATGFCTVDRIFPQTVQNALAAG